MDLFTLGQRLLMTLPLSNSTSNSTMDTQGTSDLPIRILESVVPGYSVASRFLLHYFSIDISFYVSILAFLYAANKASKFFSSKLADGFRHYCTSNVHIDGDDDLYDLILQWIAENKPDISPRYVVAKTQYGSTNSDSEKQEDTKAFLDAALDENGIFNFGRASARIPPRFEPSHGSHFFWHTWFDLFMIYRTERRRSSEDGRFDRLVEELDIRCIGRTTAATKRLIAEIKVWSVNKQTSRTEIRSPCSPDHGWYRRPWSKTSERPCRPMSTVILDPEQKSKVVQDINEFLHPLSSAWYSRRGVPYRRGFLFHGPPGTGKTSLSFALAGLFGLGIYIIPLMDPDLSEAYLGRLFNTLPRRCIVLLEDIDTAGVEKRDEAKEDDDEEAFGSKDTSGRKGKNEIAKGAEAKKEDSSTDIKVNGHDSSKITSSTEVDAPTTNGIIKKPDESETAQQKDDTDSPDPQKLTLTDLAKVMLSISNADSPHKFHQRNGRLYRRKRQSEATRTSPERASNISLSGLLNVIDGVATHEGRILIMTTNHPEKLDAALIRAGRVDMQVEFTYATKQQIKYLFTRMYQHDVDLSSLQSEGRKITAGKKSAAAEASKEGGLSEAELDSIAQQFADELPGGTFAPSDIQGYLLLHKKNPRVALEEVGAWKTKRLSEMAEKDQEK